MIAVAAMDMPAGKPHACPVITADSLCSSIYTLSVAAATESGSVPWYSENCASTLAAAFSSGTVGEKMVVTTDLNHTCTVSHTGTSAAAPIAAGIVGSLGCCLESYSPNTPTIDFSPNA